MFFNLRSINILMIGGLSPYSCLIPGSLLFKFFIEFMLCMCNIFFIPRWINEWIVCALFHELIFLFKSIKATMSAVVLVGGRRDATLLSELKIML